MVKVIADPHAPVVPRLVPLNFAYRGGAVYAGSYREGIRNGFKDPARLLRVNMAAEVKQPAEITVPAADFGVPDADVFMDALTDVAFHLIAGKPVFVGCGYGIGRTGTFLAALCALDHEVLWILRKSTGTTVDPVREVRARYHPRAVETEEQAAFVKGLNYRGLAKRVAFRIKPFVLLDKRFWFR